MAIPLPTSRKLPSFGVSKLWRALARSRPQPVSDPMVNQAQMATPSTSVPSSMTTTRTIPAPPYAAPQGMMRGGDVPAGMPNQLMAGVPGNLPMVPPSSMADQLTQAMPMMGIPPTNVTMAPPPVPPTPPSGTTPDAYLAASAAYNPSLPNPSVPVPINPQNDYRSMIDRLAQRGQRRADLYNQLMPGVVKNLPAEYQQAYSASIPDVSTNLSAYNDALAGAAMVAPQLEELLAQLPKLQQQQQSTSGFTGLDDPELAALAAKATKKK